MFNKQNRRTSCFRECFIGRKVYRVEEKSIVEKRLNSDSYRAEIYHIKRNKGVLSSLVNSNKGVTVLLSQSKQIVKQVA